MVFSLGLLAIAGCSSDSEYAESTPEVTPESAGSETSAPAEAAAVVAVGKGHPAPDFNLNKINGGQLQLSSLRGKIVLVDFWDTWCPPCRKALPHLQELSETYSDDVVVVGVALGKEGAEKVRTYTKDNGLTFEMVLFNNDMKLVADFGGVEAIPTTFLIDADGIIREKWEGGLSKATYEAGIKSLLGS